MTYLIALIVAIAIAALIAILSFTNLGSSYAERNAKGMAQKIITTSAEIQGAYIAREAIYGRIAGVENSSELIEDLKSKKLLKGKDFENENFDIVGMGEDKGMIYLNNEDELVCKYINLEIHGTPLEQEISICQNDGNDLSCCINP